MTQSFAVRTCTWTDGADALRRIRYDVFVFEQRVPEILEWDAADADSIHALATDAQGAPIGCARLLADGHIGRVAVSKPWRARGVGTALMLLLIDTATTRGDRQVIVNAQVAAMPFYERHGFRPSGDVFEEAGIAHRVMTRDLR
ncbi:MAG TPA: GNAT family N-acetyltransferase [Casimicrobiaceae bacterium]|nr:GNAT family N-acetyltransferase [Casimicrobiaceae bacterium]